MRQVSTIHTCLVAPVSPGRRESMPPVLKLHKITDCVMLPRPFHNNSQTSICLMCIYTNTGFLPRDKVPYLLKNPYVFLNHLTCEWVLDETPQSVSLWHRNHVYLKVIKLSACRKSSLPPPQLPEFTLERRVCTRKRAINRHPLS